MRKYQLKSENPPTEPEFTVQDDGWKGLPATNRQLKVLRLFGFPFTSGITRGVANRYCLGVFGSPKKAERWRKYVFLTNDITDESPELKPFAEVELEAVILPPNWEYYSVHTINDDPSDNPDERLALAAPPHTRIGKKVQTLQAHGYTVDGLTETEAGNLWWDVTRPLDYAITNTFANPESLSPETRLSLEVALAHWEYCPQLPRYTLTDDDKDYQRRLTKAECSGVMDIAFRILPPAVFLLLSPRNAKRHKKSLDDVIKSRST
jgi:hypothetical protein